jgi:hypothetical protein
MLFKTFKSFNLLTKRSRSFFWTKKFFPEWTPLAPLREQPKRRSVIPGGNWQALRPAAADTHLAPNLNQNLLGSGLARPFEPPDLYS